MSSTSVDVLPLSVNDGREEHLTLPSALRHHGSSQSKNRRPPPPLSDAKTDLGPYDVLLGRGTGPNEHVGNVFYRALVRRATEDGDYNAWSSIKKREMAAEIVATVNASGGRFVKSTIQTTKSGGSTNYVEVSNTVAISKVKQGFRHQFKSNAASGDLNFHRVNVSDDGPRVKQQGKTRSTNTTMDHVAQQSGGSAQRCVNKEREIKSPTSSSQEGGGRLPNCKAEELAIPDLWSTKMSHCANLGRYEGLHRLHTTHQTLMHYPSYHRLPPVPSFRPMFLEIQTNSPYLPFPTVIPSTGPSTAVRNLRNMDLLALQHQIREEERLIDALMRRRGWVERTAAGLCQRYPSEPRVARSQYTTVGEHDRAKQVHSCSLSSDPSTAKQK